MKIKKIYNGVVPNGKILNSKNTSQNDTYSCSYINEALSEVYSSEEVKTNKVWIDGKPIYRKTYQGTTTFDLGDESQLLIPASVNVDKIINYSGYVTENSGRNVLTVNDVRIVKVSDNKVLFQSTNNSLKNCPYAITFEYTKTTD